MDNKITLRRSYQKKFNRLKPAIIDLPPQGWLKTIREILGMTAAQFAKKLKISQPRVFYMEKNEKNLKISTMEKIAEVLNCDFVYAFVPRENINDTIYNQARKKAQKLLNNINKNMGLENQMSAEHEETLNDIINELIYGNITRIWDEENEG